MAGRSGALAGADPRCKLLLSLVLFAYPLASLGLAPLLADYGAIILVAALGRFLGPLARLQLPTAALSAVLAGSEVLAGYPAPAAAATGIRFLDVVAAATAFYLMTPVDEVGEVMSWMGVPEGVSMWVAISLRFVPILARDLRMIADAQSSRGLGAGGLLDWVRGLPSLVTPAIVASLVRGREVAEAVEIRGYSVRRRPRGSRWACALAASAAVALALLLAA
ncbi:MAG: energy-coupling factor transporter transmembrane component T family protein [Conexivisphaera sp.]